jgi:phosphotransferase system enzyme I (PtsP)
MTSIDHIQLLCDIDELNHLFRDSVSIKALLERTVQMIAKHTHAEVCSIYLYEDQSRELSLWATVGLAQESVGKVKLKLGEGLVGKALEKGEPVCEKHAQQNPDFRYFPGIGEEKYDSFLAVPIKRGVNKIGVLVVQRPEGKNFNNKDVKSLQAVTSQLANIIENAQFLMSMHEPQEEGEEAGTPEEKQQPSIPNFIKAKSAAPGFAKGPSLVIDKDKTFKNLSKRKFEKQYSLEDFKEAVRLTTEQLQKLQRQVEEKLSDAASLIFAAHLMILKDENFTEKIYSLIEEGKNPPQALLQVAGEFMNSFSESPSPYMQEKSKDIEDLALRIIDNLESKGRKYIKCRDKIVITTELFPSELLMLSSENVAGVILVTSGGVTAHLSILARSLQIPTIITEHYELIEIPEDTQIFLDAEIGNIYIEPSEEVLETFKKRRQAGLSIEKQKEMVEKTTSTADGERIQILSNINLISDVKLAKTLKAEGIGLYRTEFPFIVRDNFPSESEQFSTYSKVIKSMHNKPVTFRTLDVGGDKVLSYFNYAKEPNPVMGMRSIRFSLQKPEIFTEQIRAILRAGADADLRIMFPMISSVDEFLQAKEFVRKSIEELSKQGLKHNSKPRLGIMVELPSVIDLIDELAEDVEFFSIGTNDLIQFMLGTDRTNEHVSNFYLPYHPSVLRAINKVVQSANKHKREVSVCGDMAHQPEYLAFLLGIGIRTLSVEPGYILRVQQTIDKINLKEAQDLAKKMLGTSRNSELKQIIEDIREKQLKDVA